jgi:hypothetical protein
MITHHTHSPQLGIRRLGAGAVVLLSTACATGGPARARVTAVRGVCGAAPADTSCTVRSVERTRGGYLVTVDRRPPAGQDRVAVRVRRGSLEVTPVDTATRAPRD